MSIDARSRRSLCLWCLPGVLALAPLPIEAQTRSMAQDSTIDNLWHAPGTVTTPLGTLGRVRRAGDGTRAMLLISGMGFGEDMWTEFMDRHKPDYRMLAVTLPGFGGTRPLPMPPRESRFVERPWIGSSVDAITALLDRERITRVTIVAHWAIARR